MVKWPNEVQKTGAMCASYTSAVLNKEATIDLTRRIRKMV